MQQTSQSATVTRLHLSCDWRLLVSANLELPLNRPVLQNCGILARLGKRSACGSHMAAACSEHLEVIDIAHKGSENKFMHPRSKVMLDNMENLRPRVGLVRCGSPSCWRTPAKTRHGSVESEMLTVSVVQASPARPVKKTLECSQSSYTVHAIDFEAVSALAAPSMTRREVCAGRSRRADG